MRRKDLVAGVHEVLVAFKLSSLSDAISSAFRAPLKADSPLPRETVVPLMHAFSQYAVMSSRFSPAAISIVENMKLGALSDPTTWATVVSDARDATDILFDLNRRMRFAEDNLPGLIHLVQPDILDEVEEGIRTSDPKFTNNAVLSLVLVEADGIPSTPFRVANLLEGVQGLYESCAVINNEQVGQLRLIACDSGSDQTFDLLGVAKVVECVKDVLNTVLDRVFYFREHQASQRIKLVAEALPVLKGVDDLQQSGGIDPEAAARLKLGITTNVEKFLLSKAMVAEMEDQAQLSYNPRLLLAPERGVLPANAGDFPGLDAEQGTESENAGSLTPSEKAQLDHLMQKSKNGNSGSTRKVRGSSSGS